jgi:hypothetical protein
MDQLKQINQQLATISNTLQVRGAASCRLPLPGTALLPMCFLPPPPSPLSRPRPMVPAPPPRDHDTFSCPPLSLRPSPPPSRPPPQRNPPPSCPHFCPTPIRPTTPQPRDTPPTTRHPTQQANELLQQITAQLQKFVESYLGATIMDRLDCIKSWTDMIAQVRALTAGPQQLESRGGSGAAAWGAGHSPPRPAGKGRPQDARRRHPCLRRCPVLPTVAAPVLLFASLPPPPLPPSHPRPPPKNSPPAEPPGRRLGRPELRARQRHPGPVGAWHPLQLQVEGVHPQRHGRH